jgi:NAD kinase
MSFLDLNRDVALPKISGNGFCIRPFVESDVSSLQRNINVREVARAVSHIPFPYTLEHAKAWVAQTENVVNEQSRRVDFVIDVDGEVAGSVAFINVDRHKAQMSYWLNPKYQRRGIMQEAVRLLVAFGFEGLGLIRIYAYVYERNFRSKRVLERAGFKFEGIHEKEWLHVIKGERQIFDSLYYSVVNPRAKKKSPKRFAVTAVEHPDYSLAGRLLKSVAAYIKSRGYEVVTEYGPDLDLPDLTIAIGGDGFMMKTTREFSKLGVPTIGLNAGKVGFLTSIESDTWESGLDKIFSGNYEIENRFSLGLRYRGREFGPFANEVALHHPWSIAHFEVKIGDEVYARNLPASGLVIATATGSTGYNLSIDGPVVSPRSPSVVMKFEAPAVLSTRALVLEELSRGEIATITVKDSKRHLPVNLWADEYSSEEENAWKEGVEVGESVEVFKHHIPLSFATFSTKDYIKALRHKKKFGE